MSATSLEAAWDHFVADCAAEGVPVEPVALIESGALGRRLTRTGTPDAFVVAIGERAWGRRWAS